MLVRDEAKPPFSRRVRIAVSRFAVTQCRRKKVVTEEKDQGSLSLKTTSTRRFVRTLSSRMLNYASFPLARAIIIIRAEIQRASTKIEYRFLFTPFFLQEMFFGSDNVHFRLGPIFHAHRGSLQLYTPAGRFAKIGPPSLPRGSLRKIPQ